MIDSAKQENDDFFLNLWKCPYRRWWRYGRKFLVTFTMGMLVWGSINFGVVLLKSPSYFPYTTLMFYITLTTAISCILAIITHYVQLRQISRFTLVRVFRSPESAAEN
jgi:hypothetical protein